MAKVTKRFTYNIEVEVTYDDLAYECDEEVKDDFYYSSTLPLINVESRSEKFQVELTNII